MKKLTIFGIVLATIGVVLWNMPGVKSRRLGGECSRRYNSAIETATNDERRKVFTTAQDVCYANIARQYRNTQLCDRIGDEQMKSICYNDVYYWNKSIEFCETDDQKNTCLYVISIKNKDKSICSKMDDATFRELCERD